MAKAKAKREFSKSNTIGRCEYILRDIRRALTVPITLGVTLTEEEFRFYVGFDKVPYLHKLPSLKIGFSDDEVMTDDEQLTQQIVGAITGYLQANLPAAAAGDSNNGDPLLTLGKKIMCPKCLWKGQLSELIVKHNPKLAEDITAHCPKCDHTDAFGEKFVDAE